MRAFWWTNVCPFEKDVSLERWNYAVWCLSLLKLRAKATRWTRCDAVLWTAIYGTVQSEENVVKKSCSHPNTNCMEDSLNKYNWGNWGKSLIQFLNKKKIVHNSNCLTVQSVFPPSGAITQCVTLMGLVYGNGGSSSGNGTKIPKLIAIGHIVW